jgi:hypothetical protein
MQTEKFQIERALAGTDSWEQMAPSLDTQDQAQDLVAARRIENLYSPTKYQYRVVCLRRIVMQER